MNRTITQATLDALKAADYTKEDWHYPLIEGNPDVPEFVKGYMSANITWMENQYGCTSKNFFIKVIHLMEDFVEASGTFPEPPL